jgi:hypothetical protein
MNWQDIPDLIKRSLDLITAYSVWAWLLVIGLVLVVFSLVRRRADGKAFWDIELRNVPLRWALVLGLVFMGLSQASVFTHFQTARQISPALSFKHLTENNRVRYVIRIVAYDAGKDRETLSVGRICYLGLQKNDYVFVGDYEELRNYTVLEAIYKLGGSVSDYRNLRATVIIFPLDRRMLYPANARGLLQVINLIDRAHNAEPNYQSFNFEGIEPAELKSTQLESYAWDHIKTRFRQYEKKSDEFVKQRQRLGATAFLGEIGSDWQAEGYAKIEGMEPNTVDTPSFQLDVGEKDPLKVERKPCDGQLLELFSRSPSAELNNLIRHWALDSIIPRCR